MTATLTSTGRTVRLTRRGRTTIVLLLAAVLFGAFSLGRSASQAAGTDGTDPAAAAVEQTTVQPGESLWSVAQRIAPDNDPREVVQQIKRLNDLESAHLQVGQLLLLPLAT